MYKKLTFALTFISFLMLISCAKPGEKAWRNVTSIDEILGKWEGIVHLRYSENPALPMFKIPVTLSFFIDNNQNYIYEMTYDFEQMLDVVVENSMIDGEVYLTKDELWEMISADNILEKYFLREIKTIPFEGRDTFDSDNYQIYRSGNRLKWLRDIDIMPEPFIVQEEILLQRRE